MSEFDQLELDAVNMLASDGLHIQLIDAATVMNPQIASLWYTDGFHPNNAGHAAIAAAWQDALSSVLLPMDRGSAMIYRTMFGRNGNIVTLFPQFGAIGSGAQLNVGALEAYGAVSQYQPNRTYIASSGGTSYHVSTGPNLSTRGLFSFLSAYSDGSGVQSIVHGSSDAYLQGSDGSGTSGNFPIYDANGGVKDSTYAPASFLQSSKVRTVRIASCSTTSTQFSNCTLTVTWPTAFADTNYTAICSGDTFNTPATVAYYGLKSTSTILAVVVNLTNGTAVTAGNINCIAIHD